MRVVQFLIAVLFFGIATQAQQVDLLEPKLAGNAITLGATAVFESPNLGQPNLQVTDSYSLVTLGIDANVAPTPFSYEITITYNALLTAGNGAIDPLLQDQELTITYSPFAGVATQQNRMTNTYTNREKVAITITDVVVTNTDNNTVLSTVPNNVILLLGYSGFESALLSTQTPGPVLATPVNSGCEMLFTWQPVVGAIAYQLEWTWLDNYSDTALNTTLASSEVDVTVRDFEHNNTRIETDTPSYTIPLIYSNGYLIYRVRAVGYFDGSTTDRYYGDWTSPSNPLATKVSDWTHVAVTAHEEIKNWQFQASYAEEGKKKEVVSYFDGTLRNRQTVTKINSDNNAIVGEVIYDNQGRPAVEVLPVPSGDNKIKYYNDFNLNPQGSPFTHNDFDWDDPNVQECEVTTTAMTGNASLYYSPNTYDNQEKPFQEFVPDAEGYPYSQIEYTPDNTGRIRRKSGVGPTHKLGTDHEMKYFYAVPTQEELNRLFGYRVGNATHYKKNMVVDPNGQVSISYIDPQGRTIATALAGDAAATPNIALNEERNGTHLNTTTDILNKTALYDTQQDSNVLFSTGAYGSIFDGLRASRQVLATSDGAVFNITYALRQENTNVANPNVFIGEHCDEAYPFVYDLSVNMLDDCANEQLDQPLSGTVSENSSINPTYPLALPEQTMVADQLPIGSYTLSKTLTVNSTQLEDYVQDYITRLTTEGSSCYIDPALFAPDASINECFTSCEDCVTSLGTQESYIVSELQLYYVNTTIASGTGTNTVTVDGFTISWTDLATDSNGNQNIDSLELSTLISTYALEWQLLKVECNQPCDPAGGSLDLASCQVYDTNLRADISPGGQYGDVTFIEVAPDNFVITDGLSIFNEENVLLYNDNGVITTTGNTWRNPVGGYKDEFGAPAEIIITPAVTDPNEYTPAIVSGATIQTGTTNTGASYQWVRPEDLANVSDFINLWNSSWSDALLPYHPEFCYLNYAQAVCDLNEQNITVYYLDNANQVTSEDRLLGSDGFNAYLRSVQTASLAQTAGLFNTPESTSELLDKDPYFNDQIAVLPSNIDVLRSAIMQHALLNDYEGNGMTMFEMAYTTVLCQGYGNVADCAIVANDPDITISDFNAITSEALRNQVWNVFVGFYISQKMKIDSAFSNAYAESQGCYNGCIGTPNAAQNSPVTAVINSYTQATTVQNYANTGTVQLCSGQTASLLEDKLRHFQSADQYYDATTNTPVNGSDYGNYTQTGRCPLSFNLEYFLNGLFLETTPTGQGYDVTDDIVYSGNYLTTDLIAAFSSDTSLPTGTIEFTGAISGTNLTFSSTNFSGTCSNMVTLNDSGSGFSWSNYNANSATSGWSILGVSQLIYNENTSDIANNIFGFDVLMQVRNGSTIEEAVFKGTTCIAIGECTVGDGTTGGSGTNFPGGDVGDGDGIFDGDCEAKANFETSFKNILNGLNTGNNIGNTTALNTIPEYINDTYLQEYLGDPDKLAVWAPISGGYKITVNTVGVVTIVIDFPDLQGTGAVAQFSAVRLINPDTSNNYSTIEVTYTLQNGGSISTVIGTTSKVVNCDCSERPISEGGKPCDCIPQTVAPVSCTVAYQDWLNLMQFDGNGISTTYPGYELTDYYSEENFCNLNFGYLVNSRDALDNAITPYAYFLSELGVTDASDFNFLSLAQFGDTALNYGYHDIYTVIAAYKAYDATANANTPTNTSDDIPWSAYVNEVYLPNNTGICPPAPLQPKSDITIDISDVEDDCLIFSGNVSDTFGSEIYNQYIQTLANQFRQDYIAQALGTAVEDFEMTYNDKEYQYTLYYYDQAGNLTQTVAPEGVNRLEITNQTLHQQINSYRETNPAVIVDGSGNTSLPTEDNNLLPQHKLQTEYQYNSLNQLIWQKTPDGGITKFAYDELGRIIASQNANQAVQQDRSHRFSYTIYDAIGRIIEAGEVNASTTIEIDAYGQLIDNATGQRVNSSYTVFPDNIGAYSFLRLGIKTEVTHTIYDEPLVLDDVTNTTSAAYFEATDITGYSNRNRVTGVLYFDAIPDEIILTDFDNACFYDYDVHGNVKELVHVNTQMAFADTDQHIKRIQYDYDLISGNVHRVTYQKDREDQFIHRYDYDADNRITAVYTSSDNVNWEQDASYAYYDHGPLARTVTGNDQVQGTDYIYTIHGWLKAVNSENATVANDIGGDGVFNNGVENRTNIAKDAYGFSLNYYDGDYSSAGATANSPFEFSSNPVHGGTNNLYNGNIKQMVTSIQTLSTDAQPDKVFTQANRYQYDQLNRIKSMHSNTIVRAGGSTITNVQDAYASTYSFDKNGNLMTLTRDAFNQASGSVDRIDNFNYYYKQDNNQLTTVRDTERVKVDNDLDDQFLQLQDLGIIPAGTTFDPNNSAHDNYVYDLEGRLVQDKSEAITISWRVDGKVKKVVNGKNGKQIEFQYDGLGNRIGKKVTDLNVSDSDNVTTTFYSRDAQGNVLTIFERKDGITFTGATNSSMELKEHHLYGSSRLGIQGYNDVVLATESDSGGIKTNKTAQASALPQLNALVTNNEDVLASVIPSLLVNPSLNLAEGRKATWEESGRFRFRNNDVYALRAKVNLATAPTTWTSIGRLVSKETPSNPNKPQRKYVIHLQVKAQGGGYIPRVVLRKEKHATDGSTNEKVIYKVSDTIAEQLLDISFNIRTRNNLAVAPHQVSIEVNGMTYTLGEGLTRSYDFNDNENEFMDTTDDIVKVRLGKTSNTANFSICKFVYEIAAKKKKNTAVIVRDFDFSDGNLISEEPLNNLTATVANTTEVFINNGCGDPSLDQDGDSIADTAEDSNGNGDLTDDDSDGDGVPNYLDTDDDGDGVLTLTEIAYGDTDSDGIPNYLDIDDDNDGYLTKEESMTADSDGDGIPDALDAINNPSNTLSLVSETDTFTNTVGDKQYEFSNHLGNVLSVISDRKLPVFDGANNLSIFMADVLSYNDYYPFGYALPGRSASASNYRYGFQGQEKDDEIKGQGLSYSYTYRMHDPRVGRFFAVDPMGAIFPHNSPYAFSENRVIDGLEIEGLETLAFHTLSDPVNGGKFVTISGMTETEVADVFKQYGYEYNKSWYIANRSSNQIWDVFKSQEMGTIIRYYPTKTDWLHSDNLIDKKQKGTFGQWLNYTEYNLSKGPGRVNAVWTTEIAIPGTGNLFGLKMQKGYTATCESCAEGFTKYSLVFNASGVDSGMYLGYEFKYDAEEAILEYDFGVTARYRFIYGKVGNQGIDISMGAHNKYDLAWVTSTVVRKLLNIKGSGWGMPGVDAGFEIDISAFSNYIESEDWEGLFNKIYNQVKTGVDTLKEKIKDKDFSKTDKSG